MKQAIPVDNTAFLRDHPYKSMKLADTASTIAMAEVRAVNTNSIKKLVEMIRAPGNFANKTGSVLKTRPGPLPGVKPKVNMIGNIVSPARIDIMTIITPMIALVFGISSVRRI